MEAEKVVQISPLIRRITAGNGSVFTGPGTNTYLVGNEDVTVIDPGPAMEEHIDAILAASKNIKQVVVTHTHPDHSPGVRLMKEKLDIPAFGMITKSSKNQDITFNPSRKAVQIAFNPKVQCVIRPDGEDGIKELQIDGFAKKITDQSEKDKAKQLILKITQAFSEYMHDDFLIANDVVGYYKIKPTTIKYVDFYADTQFEWMELPENKPNLLSELVGNLSRILKYWITIIRAPFLTATIAPILLGSAIAYNEFGTFDWSIFWLVFVGALFAHIGTNVINV